MIHNTNKESGYLALMSAIIIAGVLMAVVFTLSFKGFMTRFNLLDNEYKKRSFNYAQACADTAILKVIENNSYAGETIPFGTEECIVTVTHSGTYIIQAKSLVPKSVTIANKATSNIKVILNADFSVASRKECRVFTGC